MVTEKETENIFRVATQKQITFVTTDMNQQGVFSIQKGMMQSFKEFSDCSVNWFPCMVSFGKGFHNTLA